MNRHLSARSVAGIRIAALLLAAAWLTSCGILPKQETLALYRPEPTIAVDAAWPQAKWQLQIARPYADDTHDSARILVRPQPGELQVYKGAAWTQPAPDLVLDTLLRAFADSRRLAGVARRGEGVSAQYELLLDLRRFESDYDGNAMPSARIEIGARLVNNAGNRVVATRVFDVTTPADGTDVARINRAFAQGLSDTSTQLIGWTLSEGQRDSALKR
ncbi:MAG: ABC-type transport auxiliary lipoprotein family protein [Lysobacteraceae bacterium]